MKKQLLTALLLASILASASCGSADDTDAKQPETATAAVTETAAEDDPNAYPYEIADLGGYTLRVLNVDFLWDMFVTVDTEATTGEVLNDAVFNRNRLAEEKMNFTIKETRTTNNDLATHNKLIQDTILAGEDLYDVMYACIYYSPAMLTDGYFQNLLDVDGLHFENEWWDAVVSENTTITGCQFTATGPMHLMPYDSAWVLFFNQDMMNKNDMELPYDLVREGKWTHEALGKYTKAIANLNGDAAFKWSDSGNAVYGISAHPDSPAHFITATGEYIVRTDDDGVPYFAPEHDRFFSVMSSLAAVLDTSAGSALAASSADLNDAESSYMNVFYTERSLFLTAEIKAAQLLRDMEPTFGIVPLPKLDEAQENYRCDFVQSCLFYTIPVTNTHVDETAAASDYLSYLSLRDVVPVYYENVVQQKGLRNQDSIDMLEIILANKTIDLGNIFGWNTNLMSAFRPLMFKGSDAVASYIERHKPKIEKSISDTIDAIEDTLANS